MKRASFILTLLLAFLFNAFGQDITPPVLHAVRLSPTTVNAGDTIWIELDITDDISGVNTNSTLVYTQGLFNSGYYGVNSPTFAYLTHVSGITYKGYAVPTIADQIDSLFIREVRLSDIGNNRSYIDIDSLPTGHPFKVGVNVNTPILSGIDTTPPVLDSIWLTRDTLGPGDTLEITISTHDDRGGTVMFNTPRVIDPNGDYYGFASSNTWRPPKGNLMTFRLGIPKYGDNGTFRIDRITLTDSSNNVSQFYDIVDFSLPFTLINRIEDHEPPQLINIELIPDSLHRGDTATIRVTVRDTISGIFVQYNKPSISGRFENQYGQQRVYWSGTITTVLPDSIYEWQFVVDEFAADGPWNIPYFVMVDSAGNEVYHYSSSVRSVIDSFNFYVYPDSLTYINGNIRTSTGAPLQNSRVYTVKFTPSDSLLISNRATYTDLNGDYQFISEARDSNVYIKAIPNDTLYPNEIPTYWDSSWLIADANLLIVDTTQVTVDTFTTLAGTNTGGHGFVTGYVWQGAGKNSPGDPVANLPLILVNDQGQPIAFATTDAMGLYQFTNVPDGTYQVYADWIGINNSLAPSISLTADNYELTDMDFKVEGQQLIPLFTGVNEIDIAELGIYPNPSTGMLYIQSTEGILNGEVNVSIFNIGGQQVHHTVFDSEQNTILDLSDLNNGLYLILLTDGEQSISSRVQIQK